MGHIHEYLKFIYLFNIIITRLIFKIITDQFLFFYLAFKCLASYSIHSKYKYNVKNFIQLTEIIIRFVRRMVN